MKHTFYHLIEFNSIFEIFNETWKVTKKDYIFFFFNIFLLKRLILNNLFQLQRFVQNDILKILFAHAWISCQRKEFYIFFIYKEKKLFSFKVVFG